MKKTKMQYCDAQTIYYTVVRFLKKRDRSSQHHRKLNSLIKIREENRIMLKDNFGVIFEDYEEIRMIVKLNTPKTFDRP